MAEKKTAGYTKEKNLNKFNLANARDIKIICYFILHFDLIVTL